MPSRLYRVMRDRRRCRTRTTRAGSWHRLVADTRPHRKSGRSHRFVADVLTENYAMRRVLHDVGWPTTQHRDGPVLSVEVDIDAIDASALQRK